METTQAEDLKPSTLVVFGSFGDVYKVRSVVVKSDHVEVTFFDTNEEQPYWYERDFLFHVV